MICPTCGTTCSFICPTCYESVFSEWHSSDNAKQFGEKQKMAKLEREEFQKNFTSKFKKGVSLIHKFDKSLYYSVECSCCGKECGSIVEIEVDDKWGIITLHFYKDIYFDFWRYPDDVSLGEGFINFIKDLFCNKLINGTKRFLYRWKKAFILGFTGEIKLHGDFTITDVEHINNFIEALQEGRDYCVKVKK